jgi:hypothetical protein
MGKCRLPSHAPPIVRLVVGLDLTYELAKNADLTKFIL